MIGPPGSSHGRQYERTAFAWLRTSLALTAVTVLLVREPADAAGAHRAGIVALVALIVGLAVAVARSEQLALHPLPAQAPGWAVRALVAAVVGLQLVSLIVVL